MLFIAIIVFIILCMLVRTPLLVGDTHAHIRYILLYITVGLITCRKVIFLGDIIDGPKGWPLWKSSMAIKLVRWFPWADTILGNHEVYSVFSSNAEENASYWKEEVDEDGNFRPWTEWCKIRKWLTKSDINWLKSRPLFIEGHDWAAFHAKPLFPLPARFVEEKPTSSQIELLDNSKQWLKKGGYHSKYKQIYVGHTPIKKLSLGEREKVIQNRVMLLDGGAKKGGKPFSAVIKQHQLVDTLNLLMLGCLFLGIFSIFNITFFESFFESDSHTVYKNPFYEGVSFKEDCIILLEENTYPDQELPLVNLSQVCVWRTKSDLIHFLSINAQKNILILSHGYENDEGWFLVNSGEDVLVEELSYFHDGIIAVYACRSTWQSVLGVSDWDDRWEYNNYLKNVMQHESNPRLISYVPRYHTLYGFHSYAVETVDYYFKNGKKEVRNEQY